MIAGQRDEHGGLIEAFGPGHLQAGHARRVRRALAVGVASAGELDGRTRRRTSADTPTPQLFMSHPSLVEALDPAVVGSEVFPHLPGRYPAAGWDGENDSRAPEATLL